MKEVEVTNDHLPQVDQWPENLHAMANLKANHISPFFLPVPQFYGRAWHYSVWNNLGYLGTAVPAVSPPNLLPIPSYMLAERENLEAVQALFSSSPNTGALSTLSVALFLTTNPKHNPLLAAVLEANSVLARPSAQHPTGTGSPFIKCYIARSSPNNSSFPRLVN